MSAIDDVMKYVATNEIRWVDLQFFDIKGVMHRVTISNRKLEEALPFLRDLVKEHGEQPLFRRVLAAQLHHLGRTQEAVGELDALGEALFQEGRKAEAADVVSQIVAMDPPNAGDYRKLLTQITGPTAP